MKIIEDFSDDRNKAWCIHCNRTLSDIETNRDHVPTQSLLRVDLLSQENIDTLPWVRVCKECNQGFSLSEQYLVTIISSVISGSSDPADQIYPKAGNILRGDKSLRRDLRRARKDYQTFGGDHRTVWDVDIKRLKPALIKNARGHIYHEYGEPVFGPPTHSMAQPLEVMSDQGRRAFFHNLGGDVWPEVGSRMMTRLAEGQNLLSGWVVVQPNWYQYTVFQCDGLVSRSLIGNYLAVEIGWSSA